MTAAKPSPRDAAIMVLRRFGRIVMLARPDGKELAGSLTSRFGNAETNLTFRYVRRALPEAWAEQKAFLRTIGLNPPDGIPLGFELWEMVEVLDPCPHES